MKSSGKFVVCDRGNERSRMQIFTKHGHFVRCTLLTYLGVLEVFDLFINLMNINTLKNIFLETPPLHRKIAIRYIDIVAGLAITR